MEPGSLHPEEPRNWSLETMQFAGPQTWQYFFGGFHQHGDPKRMFYNGKSQSRMDDLGVALIFGNLHLLANLLIFLSNILLSYMLKIFIGGRDWLHSHFC